MAFRRLLTSEFASVICRELSILVIAFQYNSPLLLAYFHCHIFNSVIYCLLLLALELLISSTLSSNLCSLTSHLFRVNWLSRWFGATFWTQMVSAVCSGPLWCCLWCIIRQLSPQGSRFTQRQRSLYFLMFWNWQLCCSWHLLESTTDEIDALGTDVAHVHFVLFSKFVN